MQIFVEPSDYVLRNSGDTAMLEVAITRLSGLFPHASINVLSDVPGSFPRWAPHVHPVAAAGRHAYVARAIRARVEGLGPPFPSGRVGRWLQRFSGAAAGRRRAEIQAFIDGVSQADLVIATGMGGITDAFAEYASGVLTTFELAIRHGAVTAMMGQGMGPLADAALVAHAREILPKIDLIALREELAGKPLLRALGVSADRVVTTGDDAIEVAYERRAAKIGHGLGINLRAAPYSEVDGPIVARVREAVHHASRQLGAPVLPLPISRVSGEADHLTIGKLLAGYDDSPDGGSSLDSPHKVLDQILMCRSVLTGSYHAGVFALSVGVPVVALARSQYYIDKFRGLAHQFGVGCEVIVLHTPDFEQAVVAAIQSAWQSAEAVRPDLLAAAARQIQSSRAAYQRLYDLVSTRRRHWWRRATARSKGAQTTRADEG